MKTIAYLLPALLLSCAVLVAGEGTLLEQIQAETRTLAEAANQTVVRITTTGRFAVRGVRSGRYTARHPVAAQNGTVYYYPQYYSGSGKTTHGVLVGSPAKLVVAYGTEKQLTIQLPDGKSITAKLLDADADLGVAVYGLPRKIAATLQGLEVARDWQDLRTGSIAVHAGTEVGLTLVRRSYPGLGWLYTGERNSGTALIGPRRKLLGLSAARHATVATAESCSQCHAADTMTVAVPTGARNAQAAYLLASQLALGATSGSTANAPHGYIGGPVIARALDDIAKHGRIRHGYLGVVLGNTAGEGDSVGVTVNSVLEGSPAAKAGLRAGDGILSIDGMRTRDGASLSRALVLKRPGEQVQLTWRRSGHGKSPPSAASITMGDRTAAQKSLVTEETLGMTCMDIGPELRRFLNLGDNAEGVAVSEVHRGGPAYKAGLRRGDLIVWGGDADVADLEELRALLAASKNQVKLRAKRPSSGHTILATVKVPDVKSTPR